MYTSKYALIVSKISFCSIWSNFNSFNLILSFAILNFSKPSPPSNIFLLIESVEVIESSFTYAPAPSLCLLDVLYVVEIELDQSFEEYASCSECLVASNQYFCDFNSRLFLKASLIERSNVKLSH